LLAEFGSSIPLEDVPADVGATDPGAVAAGAAGKVVAAAAVSTPAVLLSVVASFFIVHADAASSASDAIETQEMPSRFID
jgi:hypothetical protein